VQLSLSILTSSYDSLTATICPGSNYNFNGEQISNAGYYYDTTTNDIGCDSIIFFQLNVGSYSYSNIQDKVCQGNSYNFNGQNITNAGNYADTVKTANGCDSIVNLSLSVLPASIDTIIVSICPGYSYYFNGKNILKQGYYYDSTTNYIGCDSVTVLNLISGNYIYGLVVDTICKGSIYNFNGKNISNTGNYTDTLKTSGGCDSIITLVLTVNNLKSLGNISGNSNVYMHDTLTYSASSNAFGFVWTVAGGTIISGQGTNQVQLLWDTANTGNISVYSNCYDASSLNITITSGINIVNQISGMNIFPNPSDRNFYIQFSEVLVSKTSLNIYNIMGQKVYYTILQNGTQAYKVSLGHLSKGIYILCVGGERVKILVE